MNSIRLRTSLVLAATVALSSMASAQTYAFTTTELGRIVPARFATTTQQLLASVDVATSAPVLSGHAVNTVEKSDLLAELVASDAQSLDAVNTKNSDDANADESEKDEQGFFASTMGRASMVGLAGLAGASYFALRPDSKTNEQLSYTVGILPLGGTLANTPSVADETVTPEPATVALMGLGLGALGIVARRRRSN